MSYKAPPPPVIRFILDEKTLRRPSEQRLQQMVSDVGFRRALRQAAEVEGYTYIDQDSRSAAADFILSPAAALDPFSGLAQCGNTECRMQSATAFARLCALYSDYSVIPDGFTTRILGSDFRRSDARSVLAADLFILTRLRPLVEKGVLRFGKGTLELCRRCGTEMDRRIAEAAHSVIERAPRPSYEVSSGHLVVDLSPLWGGDWRSIVKIPKGVPRSGPRLANALKRLSKSALRNTAREHVTAVLMSMSSASKLQSVLLSGNQLEVLALNRLDDRKAPERDLAVWEAVRSIELPWVSKLSVDEVLELRETAASALPRLREQLASKLASPGADSDARKLEIIHELKSDAEAVQAELKAISKASGRVAEGLIGSLAITISVYGFASALIAPGVALGTLLSVLGGLHAAHAKDSEEKANLTSRPAYALLKAREILEHRRRR